MQDIKLAVLAFAMLALGLAIGFYLYAAIDDAALINAFNFAVSEAENFRSAHPTDDHFSQGDVTSFRDNRRLRAHGATVQANAGEGVVVYRLTLRDLNRRNV